MNPTRCPYCAEEISPDAILCPHCRTHLTRREAIVWQRDWPERRVAGVAAALSRGFGLPLTAIRVAFVVLTFFQLAGVLLYLAFWAFLPFRRGEESPLERGLEIAKNAVRRFRESVFDGATESPETPAAPLGSPRNAPGPEQSYNGMPDEPRA
jgi:phage shock protein PspC (stress-responsive transcriptional regulator)